MNTLDWILAAIVLLLAIRCFARGFVEEILSMASVVLGVVAGLILFRPAAAFLRDSLKVTFVPEILGFVAVFVIAFIIVKILERLLTEGIEAARLEGADRLLGLLLGAVEGVLLAAVVLVMMWAVAERLGFKPAKELLDGSLFAKTILPIVVPELSKVIPAAAGGPAGGVMKKP